jgi:hypothetical protein
MLPKMLALYRSMGFRFTSLDEAESDPFYDADTKMTSGGDAPILERRMAQRNLPLLNPPSFAKFDLLCR